MNLENQSESRRFVDTWTLAQMLELSERSIWRRIRAGVLPRPEPGRKPARFDIERLLRHAERVDPWLSIRLAGEVARLRGRIEQMRRLHWVLDDAETQSRVAG